MRSHIGQIGFMTLGRPAVSDVVPALGFEADTILALAAAAERDAVHPLAAAIVASACERGLISIEVTSAEEVAGFGVRARLAGQRIFVGNRVLLETAGVKAAALQPDASRFTNEGKTVVFVGVDGQVAGIVVIADLVKMRGVQT